MQPIAKYVAMAFFTQLSKIKNEISEFESRIATRPVLLLKKKIATKWFWGNQHIFRILKQSSAVFAYYKIYEK